MGAEADLQNTAREGLNERKIILQSKDFWENCWQSENPEAMYACLDSYYRWEDGIIDVFRAHRVERSVMRPAALVHTVSRSPPTVSK